ncbi:hypothetical protein TELCIR_19970, partial [Teladorsagia circumcincta]
TSFLVLSSKLSENLPNGLLSPNTSYGIPGQRNANQKLRVCCRSLRNADIDCRRRYCDFNALRPDM